MSGKVCVYVLIDDIKGKFKNNTLKKGMNFLVGNPMLMIDTHHRWIHNNFIIYIFDKQNGQFNHRPIRFEHRIVCTMYIFFTIFLSEY